MWKKQQNSPEKIILRGMGQSSVMVARASFKPSQIPSKSSSGSGFSPRPTSMVKAGRPKASKNQSLNPAWEASPRGVGGAVAGQMRQKLCHIIRDFGGVGAVAVIDFLSLCVEGVGAVHRKTAAEVHKGAGFGFAFGIKPAELARARGSKCPPGVLPRGRAQTRRQNCGLSPPRAHWRSSAGGIVRAVRRGYSRTGSARPMAISMPSGLSSGQHQESPAQQRLADVDLAKETLFFDGLAKRFD